MNEAKMAKTITELRNNWIQFQYGDYTGQAKIFDECSQYGIGGGRISKLHIEKSGDWVFNYDRGLDFSEMPSNDLIQIIELLVKS